MAEEKAAVPDEASDKAFFQDKGVFNINDQWSTNVQFEAHMNAEGDAVDRVSLKFMNSRKQVVSVKDATRDEALAILGEANVATIEQQGKDEKVAGDGDFKGSLKGEELTQGKGYTTEFEQGNVVIAGLTPQAVQTNEKIKTRDRATLMQQRQVNAELAKSEELGSGRDHVQDNKEKKEAEETVDIAKVVPSRVQDKFLSVENRFYFRDETPAFMDMETSLRAQAMHHEVITALVDIAVARGWDGMTVKGTNEFKKAVWLEAKTRDLEVAGYKPSELDLAQLAKKQEHRVQAKTVATGEHNEVHKGVDRGQSVDHSVPAIDQAKEDRKARRYEGILLEHGEANYKFDPTQKESYFAKIETAHGVETVWGVDLPRAMEESKAQAGEKIQLEFVGKKPVTVLIEDKDKDGNVISTHEETVNRNAWHVKRAEAFRTQDLVDVVKQHPDLAASAGALAAAEAAAREGKIVDAQGKPVSAATAKRFVEKTKETVARRIEGGEPVQGVKVRDKEKEQDKDVAIEGQGKGRRTRTKSADKDAEATR